MSFGSRVRALLVGGVVIMLVAMPVAAAEPDAAISCNDVVTDNHAFYSGPRASDVYDKHFSASHQVPELGTHVPQGLARWSKWNGSDDLLLVSSYAPDGGRAHLIGIDARTGAHVGSAAIDASHVGGVAIFERQGWAFVQGDKANTVRRYALDRLRQAIANSTYLAEDGDAQSVSGGASFLAAEEPGDTLWTGKFLEDSRGEMFSYRVADNGALTKTGGPWQVPKKTQGLMVTKDLFVYSTSYGRANRSNLYVVKRDANAADLDKARLYCFRAPSMSEGLALYDAHVYVAYESGAAYYRKDPKNKPRNIIEHLHRAPVSALADLLPN
ncbi:hypothetical protein [Nocardia altamirensis]|uniref:hypothetical protein n=1 Tax=Nocardia altamirensis TaxID=472158 RepID=UPI0008403FE7|nr:hypothetical protein [Nocardia altamirensis]